MSETELRVGEAGLSASPPPPHHPSDDEGLSGAIKALIEDGQTLFQAEVAYRKEQASFGLGSAKKIGVLLVLGLAFGFFTLQAIVVGLLLALAQYVGFWGSLGIVGGLLAILAVVCLMKALRAISAVKEGLGGGSKP